MATKAADRKGGKATEPRKIVAPPVPPVPTEKESALLEELDRLNAELRKLQNELKELQEENEWLQQEAQQTRVESHEYMSFISRKTQKRQNALISLSDYNAHEVEKINIKREKEIQEHVRRKADLEEQRLLKEAELKRAENELDELREYQILLEEQQATIRSLEKELTEKRWKHTENVQNLKATFLREKHNFQWEAEHQIQELTLDANQGARECLAKHSSQIREENKRLRNELLSLIYNTRALHKKRLSLEEQHRTLMREEEYYQREKVALPVPKK